MISFMFIRDQSYVVAVVAPQALMPLPRLYSFQVILVYSNSYLNLFC